MAGKEAAFTPSYGRGIANTTSTSTSRNEVDSNANRQSVTVTNTGTVVVFVKTGDSSVVATAADFPVLGGTQVAISKDARDTHIAMIATSGTPLVYAIAGSGFL